MKLMHKLRRKLFPPREVIEGYENEELVETIFRKTVAYERPVIGRLWLV